MALELTCFLAASLLVMIPGVLLAGAVGLGNNSLERWTHGSCIGLALAVFFASAISHFNLEWFYPVWIFVGAVSVGCWWRWGRKSTAPNDDILWQRWMAAALLIVAATRFAVVLGRNFPIGLDPAVFLVMAKKIQLTQHAMLDWMPFDTASVTYPTGAHTLVVVLAAFSRLPLHRVFNFLIPLLGVLSTAQIYLLARRATNHAPAAFFAALAYGVAAGDGSISYYSWGGLPNELAMVFFIGLLAIWLEKGAWRIHVPLMALLEAALILVHHHVALASGVVIAATLLCLAVKPAGRPAVATMILALLGAAALSTTHALQSEWAASLGLRLQSMGLPLLLIALAGIVFYLRGRLRCHVLMPVACLVLAGSYIACEFILPIWLSPPGLAHATLLNPSRFLNDMDYFLAIFAGLAAAFVQDRLRLPTIAIVAVILVLATSQWKIWREMWTADDVSPDYVAACDWIQQNTSADTVVFGDEWTFYLAWRRGAYFPLPDSEQHIDRPPEIQRVREIMDGTVPPDSSRMKILLLTASPSDISGPILWRGDSGLMVVQRWPPQRP